MAISAADPQRIGGPARIGVAAGLRQVAARGDGEARAQRLQHDRHDVGDEGDDQQRVAELGAAGERGGPVAGVHVAHRHQIAGPQEGREPARAGALHGDGAVHVGERRLPARPAPAEAPVYRVHAWPPIDSFQHAALRARPRRHDRSGTLLLLQIIRKWVRGLASRRSGRSGRTASPTCHTCARSARQSCRIRAGRPSREPSALSRCARSGCRYRRRLLVLEPGRGLPACGVDPAIRRCSFDEAARAHRIAQAYFARPSTGRANARSALQDHDCPVRTMVGR